MENEKKKTRTLKIYYGYHSNSDKRIPVIHLAGQYLADMDFSIGEKINVVISQNQILITKKDAEKMDST